MIFYIIIHHLVLAFVYMADDQEEKTLVAGLQEVDLKHYQHIAAYVKGFGNTDLVLDDSYRYLVQMQYIRCAAADDVQVLFQLGIVFACFVQMLGELVAVDIAQMPVSLIEAVFVVDFVFEQDIDVDCVQVLVVPVAPVFVGDTVVDTAQIVVGDYKPLVVRNAPDAQAVLAEQGIAHVVAAVSRALVGNE